VSWIIRDSNNHSFNDLIRKFDRKWARNHWELADSQTRNHFISKALSIVAPEEYFIVEYEKFYRSVTVNATIINSNVGYFSHNLPYITSTFLNKSWLQTADTQKNEWWEYSTIVLEKNISNILKEIESKGADVKICSDHLPAPVLLAEHDNACEFVCSPEIEPIHFLLRDNQPLCGNYFDEDIRFNHWEDNHHQRIRPNSRWDGSIWTEKSKAYKTISLCHKYSIPIIYP
jgi:hypothetical protein